MARLSCLLVTLAVCFLVSNVHGFDIHFHFYGKIDCPKDVMHYQIYAREYDLSNFDELGRTPYQVARKPYSFDLKFSTDASDAGTYYEVALVISHNCTDDGSNKNFGFLPPTPVGPGIFNKWNDHTLKVNIPNILNAEHEITENDW